MRHSNTAAVQPISCIWTGRQPPCGYRQLTMHSVSRCMASVVGWGFVILTADRARIDRVNIRHCAISCRSVKQSNPIYTIQPVVKPAWQRVWQPAVSCKQTSNRLSNRLSNGFDNRLTAVLNEQPLFVQSVVKPGCITILTTGCIHDTTGCQTWQPAWQRVWQPVVSCIQTLTRLSNRFDNRFDTRLYRVNGALQRYWEFLNFKST